MEIYVREAWDGNYIGLLSTGTKTLLWIFHVLPILKESEN